MRDQLQVRGNPSTKSSGGSGTKWMIRAKGLEKGFTTRSGVTEAVRGISFDVREGEIVGFLGPNGAGKSVTMKMLTTLLAPGKGTASVAGFDLHAAARDIRSRIGCVSQKGSTSDEARAGDEIVWQARLYGISGSEAEKRGRELFDALDLSGQWQSRCSSLSGGQRRRVDIAMGLIHRPELVFMDEPTTGLDPQSRANLWDHIRKLRDDFGTTLFLTTHYMDEADALCDRILIIDQGKIVGKGTPAQLRSSVARDTISLTLRTGSDASGAAGIGQTFAGTEPMITGNLVQVQVEDGPARLPELVKRLNENGIDAIAIEVASPTLDDVFLSLTGRSLRD